MRYNSLNSDKFLKNEQLNKIKRYSIDWIGIVERYTYLL